ncbi:MAG: permease [Candidatus Spyradenecus sp.]
MAWLIDLVSAFWQTSQQMALWLLWGFLFAGVLSLFFTPERVARLLGRQAGWRAVVWAVLLGVPLPLCSCGVLPVAAGLRKGGASKGATAGFLLATPQTGLDSIFATYALLGGVFAVVRPVVALLSGLTGGWLIERLDAGETQEAQRETTKKHKDTQGSTEAAKEVTPEGRVVGGAAGVLRVVNYAFCLLGNVARPLALGLAISAAILAFVPPDGLVGEWLANDWVAFPVMLLVGLPLYVCSTASIPMALALMAKGLSPGAALIFLIAGPALNGASLTTLWTLLGRRATACFLAVVAVFAVGAGLVLNAWWGGAVAEGAEACCAESTHGNAAAAVVLLALLGYHIVLKPLWRRRTMTTAENPARRVVVKGMACDHCRGIVAERLRKYPGVTAVHGAGRDAFDVEGGPLPETLAADLAELGFTLVE